ncbi:MAG: 30S ribosomal protein S16 [Deltaproteobacteria bacterium]|jgi:small subunit ribosomal protein S16|nr:30S ribosomal protein S16 [Deltaproteobacteria bacterium]
MAVKLRLARCGKTHTPFYHVVAADERKPRDGKFLEILGTYDPRNKEKKVSIKKDRVEYWMSNGAKPTETVSKLLRAV